MTTHNISIIIPVYNTCEYLSACLDSVIAQTYTHWEAILIDDGSIDNSGQICDEYAEKDNRFKVIHQKNGGVSAARLNGFRKSTGEWIFFLDSDDTLPVDALEALISHADGQKCVCGSVSFVKQGTTLKELYKESIVLKSIDYIKSILRFERRFSWEIPSKLFSRSILNEEILTLPADIKVFEDYVISIRYAKKTEHIKYIEHITYNYIQRDDSITHNNSFSLEKIEQLDKYIEEACIGLQVEEERIKGQCNMLGWIIEDPKLHRRSEWFKRLLEKSNKIKLCKTESLLITLVKYFNSGKIRRAIWNTFLWIKKVL